MLSAYTEGRVHFQNFPMCHPPLFPLAFFFLHFNYTLHKVQELKFVLLHPVPVTVSALRSAPPPSPQDLKFPVWSFFFFFFFSRLWSDAPVNTQCWLSCTTSLTVGPLGSRLVGDGNPGLTVAEQLNYSCPPPSAPHPPIHPAACLPPFLSAVHPLRPAQQCEWTISVSPLH